MNIIVRVKGLGDFERVKKAVEQHLPSKKIDWNKIAEEIFVDGVDGFRNEEKVNAIAITAKSAFATSADYKSYKAPNSRVISASDYDLLAHIPNVNFKGPNVTEAMLKKLIQSWPTSNQKNSIASKLTDALKWRRTKAEADTLEFLVLSMLFQGTTAHKDISPYTDQLIHICCSDD